MIRRIRRKIYKLNNIFVVIVTLLIVTDLIHITAWPFVLKAKKRGRFGEVTFKGMQEITTKAIPVSNTPVLVKIKDARVYIFSALLIEEEFQTNTKKGSRPSRTIPVIKISGWEHKKTSFPNYTCCYILNNGTVISTRSSGKVDWLYLGKAQLQAKQYKCPVPIKSKDIRMVSLTTGKLTCAQERDFYINVKAVPDNTAGMNKNRTRSKIGVCMKLSFGSLDPHRLVEWFEAHRLLGVDKVITYTYELNEMATKVLDYYVKIGIAEVYSFDLPEQDMVPRDVGVKNMQAWNDEQIVLFDCQERVRDHDYVAVIDSDEFITPSTSNLTNVWRTYLDKKFRGTNHAGVFFSSQVHVDTWGPTNANHGLHIGRYNNCTLPMLDRIKYVYMPSRVQPGTVSTHTFRPLTGYKWRFVPTKEATIHHYRSCRGEWMKQQRKENISERSNIYHKKDPKKCFDLKRTSSKLMDLLSNTITNHVINRIREIGI